MEIEAHRRRRFSGAVSPPPRRRIPDHLPYAAMVQVALRALAEDGGSTEASLSRYIRSAYTGLPSGHHRLLPYYLRKLVAAGDLSVPSSGRYALPKNSNPIPNPNPNPSPNPTPDNRSSAGPRGRGRPRKIAAEPAVGRLASPGPILPASQPSPVRRGRGRPPRITEPASDGEGMPRPKLILRLQRKPTNPVAGDSTTASAGGWCCLKDGRSPLSEIGAVEERNSEAPLDLELESPPPPPIPLPINDHQSNNGSSSSKLLVEPEPNSESSSSALEQPEEELSSSSPALAPMVAGESKGLSSSRRKSQAIKGRRRLWFEG